MAKNWKQTLEELEKEGMTIIEPDIEAFRKAALPAIDRVMAEMAEGVREDALGNQSE